MSATRNAPAIGASAAASLAARRDATARREHDDELARAALQRLVDERAEAWMAELLAAVRDQAVVPFNAGAGLEVLRLLEGDSAQNPGFVLATRHHTCTLAITLSAGPNNPSPGLRVANSLTGRLFFPVFVNADGALALLLEGKSLTPAEAAPALVAPFFRRLSPTELP